MRTYFLFGLKSFTTNLAYRSEVWLRTLGNFVTIMIQVSIWRAVIGEGGVNGISLEQMITYSILSTLIYALLLTHISGKVDASLKSGSIASDLIRPLSYQLYLFADGLGGVFYQLLFVVVPSFLISWLVFGIQPPASFEHFAAFVISLLLALILSFLFGYLVSLIAFWFLTHFALDWTLSAFLIVFSGSFLPLWFFPEPWASIAQSLPFQFLGYVPAAIYLGQIPQYSVVSTLLVGFGWALVLFGFVQWLWSRAIRRLVVQGG
jgi:ABC-2 type transport system permease protein